MATSGNPTSLTKKVISPSEAMKCLTDLESDLKNIGRGSTSTSTKDKWAKLTQTIKTYLESTAQPSTSATSSTSTSTDLTTPMQLNLDDEVNPSELPNKYLDRLTGMEVLSVSINRVHLIKLCQMAATNGSHQPEQTVTDLSGNHPTESSMTRFEATLTAIANDNASLRRDVQALKTQVAKSNSSTRPTNSTRPRQTNPKDYAAAAAAGSKRPATSQVPLKVPLGPTHSRPNKEKVTTIRVKPKDQGTKIDEILKGKSLPNDIDLLKSRLLFDGSKVFTTTKEIELRNFLTSLDSIEIIDKPSFKPKIKVLYVPADTDLDDVQTSLGPLIADFFGRSTYQRPFIAILSSKLTPLPTRNWLAVQSFFLD